jgi:hypothetical protein
LQHNPDRYRYIGAMIAFGGGAPPVPLASIGNAFENVDFSDLPAAETIAGRGGSPALAFFAAVRTKRVPVATAVASARPDDVR